MLRNPSHGQSPAPRSVTRALDTLKLTLHPAMRRRALIGLAGASAGLFATDAMAASIVFAPGTPLTVTNDQQLNWDVDGDSTADIHLHDVIFGGPMRLCLSANTSVGNPVFASSDNFRVQSITNATTVGPLSSFVGWGCGNFWDVACNHVNTNRWSDFSPTGGSWSGTFGFRFEAGAGFNYGVADFSVASWNGDSNMGVLTINSWAYDDSGQAITGAGLEAAPVPEPATITLTLLGLGAAGLRRRRARAAARAEAALTE